ncbi:MAG: superoxide dismutase [Bacteroidia bacterium]
MAFILPPLPYHEEALEPHIDRQTMEIHYHKHHQAYLTNLNKAIENTDADKMTIEDILKNISKYPAAVRNNAGGYYNHTLFWNIMDPKGGGAPVGELEPAIKNAFGSFEEFKKKFGEAASGRFGSGWAWLIKTPDDKLEICSTPNQDNPLMDVAEKKGFPLLGLDVWEHAYYLKYQNRRPDYITAWWEVVNWKEVLSRFVHKHS